MRESEELSPRELQIREEIAKGTRPLRLEVMRWGGFELPWKKYPVRIDPLEKPQRR